MNDLSAKKLVGKLYCRKSNLLMI